MDIKGSASEAFSYGFKQAISLSQKHYLAFFIPVGIGFLWGVLSRVYLYGGIMALMSSLMTKHPNMNTMISLRHLLLIFILTMAISILLWLVAFSGAGLILKHRDDDQYKLTLDEVISYTGNRLGPLIKGGIIYMFLPAIPAMIPVIGFIYIIGFFIYIFFIGKNYGGFFFWAYPVIAEGKSAQEGFAIAKQTAIQKNGPFWLALVLGFIVIWIINMFLGFIPYIGYLIIWVLNLIFLIYTGILYYDYQGDYDNIQKSNTNS
ncbi:MAG: hypothetical protein ACP5MB_04800 [bacterium]